MRALTRVSVIVMTAVVTVIAGTGNPAGANGDDGADGAYGDNNGDSAEVGVEDERVGDQGTDGNGNGSGDENDVVCWNDGLRYTTQEEQRNDIREEETAGREGEWGWLVCDDGRPDELMFFPDEEPVDPEFLARSVVIAPDPPVLRTNPPIEGEQLVNLDTWFWVEGGSWEPVTGEARLGTVWARVTATPRTLIIDPGDGSPSKRCEGGGTPYDASRSPQSQESGCKHSYSNPGEYTVTASIVYDASWTSNVAAGGSLGELTPPGAEVTIPVAESQAVVTD